MKEVGEAVRENISALDPTKQIVLLGIANWTTVKNSHLLERKVGLLERKVVERDCILRFGSQPVLRIPYGLVVRILAFHAGGPGSIPGVGRFFKS